MKKTIIPRILTFTLILALFLSSNAIAAKSMLDVKDIGFYLDDFLVLYKDGTVDGKGFYTSKCLSWSGVSSIRVNSGTIIGLKSDNSIPYLYDSSLKLELDSDWKNILLW